jgi:hypothetical protein
MTAAALARPTRKRTPRERAVRVPPLDTAKIEMMAAVRRAREADATMAGALDSFHARTLAMMRGASEGAAVEMARRCRIWANVIEDAATNWPLT